MKKRYVLAGLLILLIALSLLATSFVSARPLASDTDLMTSHLITIPGGSTHPDYDGNFVGGDRTIALHTGWTENLPYNTCAVAVRLAYKDNYVTHWAALRPSSSEAYAVVARTQTVDVYSDSAGVLPVTSNGTPSMYLDISSGGNVDIAITGYWLCEMYVRPTIAP